MGGPRRAEGDLMSLTQRKTAINSAGFPRSEGLGGEEGGEGRWVGVVVGAGGGVK